MSLMAKTVETLAHGIIISLPAINYLFDENNKYDMVRLAPADIESDDPLAGDGDTETPW